MSLVPYSAVWLLGALLKCVGGLTCLSWEVSLASGLGAFLWLVGLFIMAGGRVFFLKFFYKGNVKHKLNITLKIIITAET